MGFPIGASSQKSIISNLKNSNAQIIVMVSILLSLSFRFENDLLVLLIWNLISNFGEKHWETIPDDFFSLTLHHGREHEKLVIGKVRFVLRGQLITSQTLKTTRCTLPH